MTDGQSAGLSWRYAASEAQEFTTIKISSTCHLYLQFYMLAFYIVSCQESCSLWIPSIYNLTCNFSMCICMYGLWMYNIYNASVSLGLAWQIVSLTQVAHVTTAAMSLEKSYTWLLPSRLHLYRCREHLHFHDFLWPLFVTCIILLCNHKYVVLGKPCATRRLVQTLEIYVCWLLVGWSVSHLNCCWPSPAQSFLASVFLRSMTKIFTVLDMCMFKNESPLGWGRGRSFYVGATFVAL
jgi:hypothetical protein